MRNKRILLFLLLAIIIIFSACTGQDSERFVPDAAGEQKIAGSSVIDHSEGVSEKVNDSEEPAEFGQTEAKEVMAKVKTDHEAPSTATFSLRVSQDYGAVTLKNEDVLLKPKMSVMDGLYYVYADEVETAFGGGYIKRIGSLRSELGGLSKPNQDWFFIVNGIFADIGALDYYPQAGEKVWWDYHPWQAFQAANAVIGCYPEPFLHGYRGQTKATMILCRPEDQEFALQLEQALQAFGVKEIILKEISQELLSKREGPTLVIGEWCELNKYAYLAELNQAFAKNGTFVHFTDHSLELLDYNGKKADEHCAGVGVIAASGETAGDDSPLWIVSGTDKEGLRNALMLLVEQPDRVSGCFSAVITSTHEVIRLPLMAR
ncbi:MAG: DUF4430 domain-containing protein [Peptococcia bacterium]